MIITRTQIPEQLSKLNACRNNEALKLLGGGGETDMDEFPLRSKSRFFSKL